MNLLIKYQTTDRVGLFSEKSLFSYVVEVNKCIKIKEYLEFVSLQINDNIYLHKQFEKNN